MSNIEHVIEFLGDGTAQCLHTDDLPLQELGKLEMERASTVEWIDDIQKWRVWIAAGVEFEHEIRAQCLASEREYFNQWFLKR